MTRDHRLHRRGRRPRRRAPSPTSRPALVVRDPSRAPALDGDVRVCDVRRRAAAVAALEGVDTAVHGLGRRGRRPARAAPHLHPGRGDGRRRAHRLHVVRRRRRRRDLHPRPRPLRRRGRDPRDRHGLHAPARQLLHRPAALLRRRAGVIRGPAGDGRVAAVARADVADVAAAVLRAPAEHAGATYTLTGPEALTMAEVAARAGAVARARAALRERDGRRGLRVAAGGVRRRAVAARRLGEHLHRHRRRLGAPTVTDDVERVTGHPARTIEERSGRSRREVVHVAPAPVLAGLGGLHDRVRACRGSARWRAAPAEESQQATLPHSRQRRSATHWVPSSRQAWQYVAARSSATG